MARDKKRGKPPVQPPKDARGRARRPDGDARGRRDQRPRGLLICLALAAATLAVYWQVSGFDFVAYDDLSYVQETPQVMAGLTASGISWAMSAGRNANWHPLTWISHMLDVQLFGLKPGAHHVTSLLLHLANTLLLFLVLRQMTGSEGPSALVAALFALHPLHVESVAWIAERKDVLSTLFWLLTMAAYARYVERQRAENYLLVLGLYALGLMAKPMLVTLPFVLLLLDYWPFGRMQTRNAISASPGVLAQDVDEGGSHAPARILGNRHASRAATGIDVSRALFLVREKVPFFALSLVSCIVTFRVQQAAGAIPTVDRLPISARAANAVVSYVRYIVKLIFPVDLAAFYPDSRSWALWQVAGAFLILAVLSILAFWAARAGKPYVLVGWLWFLGTLVPVIGLVQVGMQSMADRYTYVPYIGFFVIIAWGAMDLASRAQPAQPAAGAVAREAAVHGRRRQVPRALAALACVWLAVLAALTWRQVGVWKDTMSLFDHATQVTRDNYVAHNILGLTLVKQGKVEEGIAHMSEALRIKPHYTTQFNLGLALSMNGKLDEAMLHFREALQENPQYAKAHAYLAEILDSKGKAEEALPHYLESLRIEPEQQLVRAELGACLAGMGRTREAIEQYEQSLRLRPDDPQVLNNLGVALAAEGRIDEAIARSRQALRFKPDYADAHLNLGILLMRRGRADEAIEQLRETLRLRPGDASAEAALRQALVGKPVKK